MVNFTRDGGTREPVMVSAPFRMEMDCNYRTTELGKADPRCAGCKWKTEAAADSAAHNRKKNHANHR